MADLPEDVLVEAHRVSSILRKEESDLHRASETTKVTNRRKALLHVRLMVVNALTALITNENTISYERSCRRRTIGPHCRIMNSGHM
jgi:hypothetical protein